MDVPVELCVTLKEVVIALKHYELQRRGFVESVPLQNICWRKLPRDLMSFYLKTSNTPTNMNLVSHLIMHNHTFWCEYICMAYTRMSLMWYYTCSLSTLLESANHEAATQYIYS